MLNRLVDNWVYGGFLAALVLLVLGPLFVAGWPAVGALLPPGSVYSAIHGDLRVAGLLGPILIAALALVVSRYALAHCDAELRRWYDRHSGRKVMS